MVDLETLFQPVLDDTPEPRPFATIRTRARLVHRRRIARALVATALLVAIGAGTVAVARRPDRARVTVVAPSDATARFHVGAPVTVSESGMGMISAFGSIWVTRPDDVARFDAATGRMLATIKVPGTSDSRNLAAGAGSVWVDDTGTQTITRIDPTRNTVVATIALPDSVLVVDGLAFVDGKLWVVRPAPNDDSRGDVVSIDPATNRVARRASIPRTFAIMAGGDHALWYVGGSDLVRVDTKTTDVTIVRHHVKALLAVANLHLWLLTSDGVIETDELNGNQLGPTIPVANTVNLTVAEGRDAVWIAGQPDSSTAGTVTPYDLVTHRPLAAPTPVGLPVAEMAALDSALWVDAGGVVRIPYSREVPVPSPTVANDDVLIFDDGVDGILAVDPSATVAARRLVTGQRGGDQPVRSIVTSGTLVVGWDDVYAAPLSTGRSRFIGKGIVIPAETPGRVWLMPFGESPATYRLVDLTGHVLLAGKGRTSGWEPVAIPGGLAFSGAGGIELWDASRDALTGTLGSAGAQVGASSGSLLAWTRHDRAGLQLTSLDTRATRPVSLPANVTGVDVSVARFSDDGTLLAVQASTKGAPDSTHSVLIVDVEHARVVRTIAPKAQFESFAWSPDGARLYLGSYGYQQPTMSVRRVDVVSGRETDFALPFGGGITFHVVTRREAGVALQGVAASPTDCAAPAVLPSNGTEPCRFHY